MNIRTPYLNKKYFGFTLNVFRVYQIVEPSTTLLLINLMGDKQPKYFHGLFYRVFGNGTFFIVKYILYLYKLAQHML